MEMKHELKIKPEYFAAVVNGEKTFEIHNNTDHNFQVGDTLILKSWDGEFNGNFVERTISYITDFEQKPGYVVLGFVGAREFELLGLVERMVSYMGMAGEEPEKESYNPIKAWMYDAINITAWQQQNQLVNLTEAIRTAPERIWLQVGDSRGDNDLPFPDDHGGVSWCDEQVMPCEVPYVRADLPRKRPAAVAHDGIDAGFVWCCLNHYLRCLESGEVSYGCSDLEYLKKQAAVFYYSTNNGTAEQCAAQDFSPSKQGEQP